MEGLREWHGLPTARVRDEKRVGERESEGKGEGVWVAGKKAAGGWGQRATCTERRGGGCERERVRG